MSALPQNQDPVADEQDLAALLAMLDYLIAEISRVDLTATQCLMLARRTLSELVDRSRSQAH